MKTALLTWICTLCIILLTSTSWAQKTQPIQTTPKPSADTPKPSADTPKPSTDTPKPSADTPKKESSNVMDSISEIDNIDKKIYKLENESNNIKITIKNISDQIFNKEFSEQDPKIEIHHRSLMGGAFLVKKVTYTINKNTFFEASQTPDERVPLKKKIYDKSVEPGDYTITLQASIVGHGFGVFSYMKSYKVELKDKFKVSIYKGQQLKLTINYVDNGNLEIRDRIEVRINKKTR